MATITKEIAHSKIGASSYYRWKACPGSVKLSQGIKSTESIYAREGTIAHDVASEALEDYFFQKGKPAIPPNMPSDFMPAIKQYIDVVKRVASIARSLVDMGHVLIEQRFDLTSIHPGLFGTADAVIYWPEEKKLTVIDYKHGAGIPVEVEGNLQLLYYGLGAMLSSGFRCNSLEIKVVQPRCDHSDGIERTYEVDLDGIIDFMMQLGEDARATEEPNAKVSPGSHCRFCPAAPTKCPEIHRQSLEIAKSQFSVQTDYSPKKLQEVLDKIPMLESYIKSVREFAYGEALHGRGAEGYKLVEKRAMRKWATNDKDVESVLTFTLGLNKNDVYKKSLLSPAQVEKLLDKDKRQGIAGLVVKESSGYKLVPESAKGTPAKLDPKSQFEVIGD